jgi:hypothetical protein
MTEAQDIKASKELGTEQWYFVGFDGTNEDGEHKIYETDKGDLFAVNQKTGKMSFEVY